MERLKEFLIEKTAEAYYDAPPFWFEQNIIHEHQFAMWSRAPGKYDKLMIGLSILSNVNPLSRAFYPMVKPAGDGIFKDAEVAYFLGRITDDIVDDDIPVPKGHENAGTWLASMNAYIEDDSYKQIPKDYTVEYLLKRTMQRMAGYRNLDIRHELKRFFTAMEREYDRRAKRISLPQEELWDLYNEEFGAPHAIMLPAFYSRLKEEDIPELANIQGRRFTFEGLADDLPKGIIGIPREILQQASVTDEDAIARSTDILSNPIIANWKENELKECDALAERLLQRSLGITGRLYVKALS